MKLKEKLTSRKFLLTLIEVICGVACLFGADGETLELVSGALLTLVPTVIYIITEGKIDAEGAKRIATTVSDVIDSIVDEEN